jgi:hypothetical protein
MIWYNQLLALIFAGSLAVAYAYYLPPIASVLPPPAIICWKVAMPHAETCCCQ